MSKNLKLNQIIAVEKGIKARVCSVITQLHKTNQKTDLFNGFSKTYTPKDEDGEVYPQENKKVQVMAIESLDEFGKSLTELLDITATKDFANCNATADVVVDGETIIENAPTTYLLFLEKQINDIKTFISNLPELDTSEDWREDINSGLSKTSSVQTNKTKKTQKPVVLYEATDRHPAQTQLITEDVIIGHWNVIKQSGAIPIPKKKKMLEKVENLSKAIKFAREKANSVDADEINVGAKLFKYLLD